MNPSIQTPLIDTLFIEDPQQQRDYLIVPIALADMPAANLPAFVSLASTLSWSARYVFVRTRSGETKQVSRRDGTLQDGEYRVIPADERLTALYLELQSGRNGSQNKKAPSPARIEQIKGFLLAAIPKSEKGSDRGSNNKGNKSEGGNANGS